MGDKFLAQRSFLVPPLKNGWRLDRFLSEAFTDISREKIKRYIKKSCVTVDGVIDTTPKSSLRMGSLVCLVIHEECQAIKANDGELSVLYRDEALAVINKPAGLTVHSYPGSHEDTLAQRLQTIFFELSDREGERPGIVHRLDKETSGLLLVALSPEIEEKLMNFFAQRTIQREYLALITGVPKNTTGEIDLPIGRDPRSRVKMAVIPNARSAQTAWRIVYRDPMGAFSLAAITIFTGRTHQIRVHMAHIGHPIIGDAVYGKDKKSSCQMLHAWKLAFEHPLPAALNVQSYSEVKEKKVVIHEEQGEIFFCCPPPESFFITLQELVNEPLYVVVTGMPGCGKSTLVNELALQGACIFSADAEVARLYKKNNDGWILLHARYGDRFLANDGSIDTAALGLAMRSSVAIKREIESLIHPLVYHALEIFWQQCKDDKVTVAVAEIPLYFESRPKNEVVQPYVIGVSCPFVMRSKRIKSTRGWSDEVILSMEQWQWAEDKKMAACDLSIENVLQPDELQSNAASLYKKLITMHGQKVYKKAAGIKSFWEDPLLSCRLLVKFRAQK